MLVACGSNSHGQLGIGHEEDVNQFEECHFEEEVGEIQSVSVGAHHTMVINDKGQVFGAGDNTHGQLGFPKEIQFQNTFHPLNFKVRQAVCLWDATVILDEQQSVWAFGLNDQGQLGVGLGIQESFDALPVSLEPKIIKLVSGVYNCFALTENGQVYAWGPNKKQWLSTEYKDIIEQPVKLSFLEPFVVVDAALSTQHALFLTQSHQVVVYGLNKFSQLNVLPSIPRSIEPRQLHACDMNVKRVAVGWRHSGFLMENGRLILCGANSLNELGTLPEVHDGHYHELQHVDDMASGSSHWLIVKQQQLYTFGWNEHGNCGTGQPEIQSILYNVPLTGQIQKIYAGFASSFVQLS